MGKDVVGNEGRIEEFVVTGRGKEAVLEGCAVKDP